MNKPAFVSGMVLTLAGVGFSFFFYSNNVGCEGRAVCGGTGDPVYPLLVLMLPGLLLVGISFLYRRNATRGEPRKVTNGHDESRTPVG